MEKHVMISYNQKSSGELAKRLNKKLKENNIKTWIDYENMNGDINSAMAQAVEGAFLVLILVTHEYCESKHCQSECSYAARHDRPLIPIRVNSIFDPTKATGPIGIKIGGLLYQDFTDSSNFETSFNSLLAKIMLYKEPNSHSSHTVNPNHTTETPNIQRNPVDIPEIVELCKSKDNYSRVEQLIKGQNANVNYRSNDGFTALIWAVFNENIEIVKLLIEHGANVNDCNLFGMTALQHAKTEEMKAYLRSKGAS